MTTADDIRRLVKDAFPYLEEPRLPGLDRAAALHKELFETIATAMLKLKIKNPIIVDPGSFMQYRTGWTGPSVAKTMEEVNEVIIPAGTIIADDHLTHLKAHISMSGNGFSQWDTDYADQETIIDRSPLEYGLPKTPEQKCDCGFFKHKFPTHVRGCPAEDSK